MKTTSNNNTHSYSAHTIRNGFIAGYSAGICGVVVGHPLDSIKVLLQTGGGVQRSASRATCSSTPLASSGHVITRALSTNAATVATQSSSINQTAMLVHKRSIRALYAGMTGPLLTIGIFQSLNFAIFDSVRRVLYQRQLQSENPQGSVYRCSPDDYLHYDTLSSVALASFISGASTSIRRTCCNWFSAWVVL